MKKITAKGIVIFMAMAILTGCSGDKKTDEPALEPEIAGTASLPTLAQMQMPVSIQDQEIIVGKTTIQELLDAGFELMVSEWNGRSIVQRELDPEETLVTGTKNTEISFWISDSSFARLSIDARNGEVRTGDAPVTRLELHLSFDAALPSDILISDVPVAELTRAKAGEMFPDFEQGDLSVTQKGADYQCTLMFSPQTLNLYQFSLRDTWGDAPEPEIKVPSI